MDTEDGTLFIKASPVDVASHGSSLTQASQNLAYFIRTHEKALANSILQQRPQQGAGNTSNGNGRPASGTPSSTSTQSASLGTSGAIASALTLGYLNFGTQSAKPGKLYLTPNQLYYLLSRFEELGVSVGPMNVRLENINSDATSSNYVSFLTKTPRPVRKSSDQDSIHSVSSVRSVMSSMSSMWPSFGLSSGPSATKIEKQKAATLEDLRYLYSALTKIPWVKLAQDHRILRIGGYEEFPFDTAVPIHVFKNLTVLEIMDADFRSFFGWDRLADQLRSLTAKRACVGDLADLLTNIVLDDMDKRRRRSAKSASSPIQAASVTTPASRFPDYPRFPSTRDSPSSYDGRPSNDSPPDSESGGSTVQSSNIAPKIRIQSKSPTRPTSSRKVSTRPNVKVRRSSASSTSSLPSYTPRNSSSNLLLGILPHSKWRFLRHLSLADNDLTFISSTSLSPVANTLQSLDLSSNLFTELPDSLSGLVSLRALNLSGCLIDSLRSLARNPLPAITVLNLRGNRIDSLAGIEKLLSLERLDLRDNRLRDPAEIARLTGIPEFREVFVGRNPLIKTHPNYRVTIFNLFRGSPGYTEDILIDASGPGYSERRQLADRVQEHVGIPVVRPAHDEEDETALKSFAKPEPPLEQDYFSKPQPPMILAEEMNRSQRRRKAPRRRIVDISQPDADHRQSIKSAESSGAPAHLSPDITATSEVEYSVGVASDSRTPREPTAHASHQKSELVQEDVSDLSETTPGVSANGELYKKKMQALKHDVGNGWLSALGEDSHETRFASPHEAFREKDTASRIQSPVLST